MEYRLLNGLRVYAPCTREALIHHILERRGILIAVNAEKILHANKETREVINRNVGYPDGIGAVVALKAKGLRDAIKIPGCELWLDIVRAHHRDRSFYLVGGEDDVIEKTVSLLKAEFSGIDIVNYRNGYLNSNEERQALISDVAARKPDIVFVAMGSPRQEKLMEEMSQHHAAIFMGLGGSFDVYVGRVERAPDWWVKHHMEWLFRLVKEPRRIRRQIHLIRFVGSLILGRL